MYRKVPVDLLEGTKKGSFFSFAALIAMITLFTMETKAFLKIENVTELSLDKNKDKKIRVNFNITMMDLACEYAAVDVVSVLGTEQNVTHNVVKHAIDAAGVKQRFLGRNRNQRDIIMYDESIEETIEELHEDGEDALPLDEDLLEEVLEDHEFVFVDFFASWCSHCRKLAPTWETLAELMNAAAIHALGDNHTYSDEEYEEALRLQVPVKIVKVDCVENKDLCMKQNIRSYPTLRLFIEGEPHSPDYRGDRIIHSFTDFLAGAEEEVIKEKGSIDWIDSIAKKMHSTRSGEKHADEEGHESIRRQSISNSWKEEEHPGCQLSGYLMVDRVPGNFHIQARSKSHDLVPSKTNVSHEVHELSFGEPYIRRVLKNDPDRKALSTLPIDIDNKLWPMDNYAYVIHDLHQAHHHYLKITSTNFDYKGRELRIYQILEQTQTVMYEEDVTPEAKFQYDLSPISMLYTTSSRHWYDYLTSVMAIIGGSFTVVGFLESYIHILSNIGKPQRR